MSHIIKPDFLQLQNEPEKTKENERRLMDEVKRLKTKILTLVEKSLKKKSRMRLPSLKMKEIQQSKAENYRLISSGPNMNWRRRLRPTNMREKNLAMEKKCNDFEDKCD